MYECSILNLKGRTHALKTWTKVPFVYSIFMSTFGSVRVTSGARDQAPCLSYLSKLSVRGWVLFVSMGVLVDAVPFLGSLVNFVSLEFGVIIDNCACISSHRGLCALQNVSKLKMFLSGLVWGFYLVFSLRKFLKALVGSNHSLTHFIFCADLPGTC